MVAPINYLAGLPQPDIAGSLTQGLQAGAAINQIRTQQQAEEQARVLKEQYSADLSGVFSNPTPQAFSQLIAKYPQQREAFKQSWDILSEDQKNNEFLSGAQAYNAIASGNIDVAKNLLDQRIEAAKNSGKDTKNLVAMRDAIDANPKSVQANIGLILSSTDPKRWSEMTKEMREAELQPGVLEKQAADVGLTRAQTNKILVETKKLGDEAAKTAIELEALKKSGGIDPVKSFEAEDKLRKEYIGLTKDFRDVQSAFQRIQLSENTAAGDIALIFNYMKMLDPGSVVREGEFATAQNAAGVPDRIQNAYNRALSGERLSPDQRKQFTGQAEKLYTGASKQEEEIRKGYERMAKTYGLNKDNIFISPEGPEKPQPANQMRASYGQTSTQQSPATARTVTVDY